MGFVFEPGYVQIDFPFDGVFAFALSFWIFSLISTGAIRVVKMFLPTA